jgi:hypothetical protein
VFTVKNDSENSASIVQLDQSDWTDQDLLTRQEARERLAVEITRTRSRLEELRNDGHDPSRTDPETTLLTRRLNAMESARDEYGPAKGTP